MYCKFALCIKKKKKFSFVWVFFYFQKNYLMIGHFDSFFTFSQSQDSYTM